ncbi:hypothetical protein LOTGIDRAFT_207467 [Lottia gigantea]|uniref:Sodium/nucleoside cotransporter n=1 Tax=Lottia gigantea TaxID=225164 RepID=V4B1G5_LOTGI|nr:hypothetical protein LOTGIDRAFT_207467 [Lottia gigantea]ESO82054.1 hypothetical protein LOTGIDRAFT_207467 [Lottia gigantea]
MQYFFGLFILKTDVGRLTFTWFGERVTEVLQNTDAGTRFVFGENYVLHPIAFKAFPVMIFVSSILSVLYYLGIMQKLINSFGRMLGFFMVTTPAESICASGSIFLGVGEVLLLVKPFVADMTVSEIAAVITSSLSTMMGSILAVCISLGIPARHIIAASVMSAPAALVISKLSLPETEKTKATDEYYTVKSVGTEKNIVEALTSGATASISLIANIIVTIISFLAVIEFVNSCLLWAGHRVGVEGLTFELVCSYLLFPAAFLMGVDTHDCKRVAELLGIKLFTLSMNAYIKMIPLLNNRKERTDVIATYALCGFSNFGTLGSALALMSAMAPRRTGDIASVGLRCIWASNVACIVTACIAGKLVFFNSVIFRKLSCVVLVI